MRIKRGVTKKRKHKKVIKAAKGYRQTYSKLYRRAKEALLHAGQYSHAHRKRRRGQMRKEWIKVINAGLFNKDISYSKFVGSLKKKNIELDRKVLANIVQHNPEHFDQIVTAAA